MQRHLPSLLITLFVLVACAQRAGATEPIAPAVPLGRLDFPQSNTANSLAVRPAESLAHYAELPATALPRQPVVRLVHREEPIGTPIDFNPFAAAESPVRQFDNGLYSVMVSDREPLDPNTAAMGPLPEPPSGDETSTLAHRPPAPTHDEQLWNNIQFPREGTIHIERGGTFRTAAARQPPLQPLQPIQPVQPPSLTPFEPPSAAPGSSFDNFGLTSIADLAAVVGGSPAQGVGAAQASNLASTDLGGLLQNATSVQSVNTTRRSPVALDPNIRGYKFGQVYSQANGAFWFPVRQDIDTMLSKIDPGMIQEVVVIPGPYGLRYGPGFSFIDIMVQDTPRYECGPEHHARLPGNVRTNGGQVYGRAIAYGGAEDWGYRISYGHRKGSDYEAGNGLLIPSSYNNRDVTAQFGYDLTDYQRLEWSYLRLDQTDTEYAAQFFDVDFLGTHGTTLRLVDEDPVAPWTQFTWEGWWNRTNFTGSITPSKRLPSFPVIQRVEFALDQEIGGNNTVNGDTFGDNVSSGTRAGMIFGDLEEQYLRLGADFRYLEQRIQENFDVTNSIPPLSLGMFSTNQPRGRLRDEGLFAEYGYPLVDGWDVALGARIDWVDTTVRRSDIRPNTSLDVDDINQHDILYSYYLTNRLELDEAWALNLGYGYAQRPPTLTERYADGVFLGLLQSGFTRVIGRTDLRPERNFQIDVGLSADYANFRGNATLFYAWVIDYVTFEGDAVQEFFDARLVRYRNTELATLAGFEVIGETDWNANITPFAKMKYVEGTDQILNAPLFSIPPLESTVGVRFHDACRQSVWDLEVGARMVATQNRLGQILILNTPTVIEERTGGFTTGYIRGSYNWTENLKLIAGIDNLFNRSYQEHLDLRLLGPTGFPAPPTRVLSPGFTPYFGIDWVF